MAKIRGYWNDKLGLTLNETIATIIITMFVIMTIWIGIAIINGLLSDQGLEFYKSFITVPLAVVTGLFVQGSVNDVWGKNKPQNNDSESNEYPV